MADEKSLNRLRTTGSWQRLSRRRSITVSGPGIGRVSVSAAPEAIAQLQMGLQLLAGLLPSPERDRQELLLQLALFSVLVGVRGYAAPETGTALTRAGELCGSAGDRSLLFPVLYGQRGFRFVRAELDAARELNEEMLRLAGEFG